MKLSGLVQRLPAADPKDVAVMPKLPVKKSMSADQQTDSLQSNNASSPSSNVPSAELHSVTAPAVSEASVLSIGGVDFTAQEVSNLTSDGVLRNVPLSAIRLRPEFQTRTKLNTEHVDNIALSLTNSGQREPITLRALEDHFELLGGHHRFEAARAIGWDNIKAIVHRCDENRAKFIATFQNAGRLAESDFEKAKAWQKALDDGLAKTQQEIAVFAGISAAEVSQCLSMLRLPGAVKEILDTNPKALSYNYAKTVLDMCKVDGADLDVIVEGVRKVADGLPQSSLKGWVASAVARKTGAQEPSQSSPKTFSSKSGQPVVDLSVTKGHLTFRNRGVVSDEELQKALVDAIKSLIAERE